MAMFTTRGRHVKAVLSSPPPHTRRVRHPPIAMAWRVRHWRYGADLLRSPPKTLQNTLR